jgi:hypothetical protein
MIWPEDSRLIEGKLPNFDSNLRRESIELWESGCRYGILVWKGMGAADVESDLRWVLNRLMKDRGAWDTPSAGKIRKY